MLHPTSPEPTLPWQSPINHGRAAKSDLLACSPCHARSGRGPARLIYDVTLGRLERGCASVDGCHLGGDFDNGHDTPAAHPTLVGDDPRRQDMMHWYGETIRWIDASGRDRKYLVSHHDAGNLEEACAPCHGPNLTGGAGPACSDCHITDAMENPDACVSCHGWPTGPTKDLAEALGRTRQLSRNRTYAKFLEEVARGFHLAHEAIPCEARDSVPDCRACHGETLSVERHHALVDTAIQPPRNVNLPPENPLGNYKCLTCHEVIEGGEMDDEIEVEVVRDCYVCHAHAFPEALPCTE